MKAKIDRLIEVEERSIQLLKKKIAPYGAIQHHEFIIAYLKAIKIVKRCPVEIIQIFDTYSDWEEYKKDYYNQKQRKGLIESKEEFNLLQEVF